MTSPGSARKGIVVPPVVGTVVAAHRHPLSWLVLAAVALAFVIIGLKVENISGHTVAHTQDALASLKNVPSRAAFAPTLANATSAPESATHGMVWIPGGEFSMGAADPPGMDDIGMKATSDSRLIHRVYVDGFWMDKAVISNSQFAAFVKATGYVTVAERKPRREDFPDTPPENLVSGSVVFSPPDHSVQLNDYFQWWSYVPGANWKHPLGRIVLSPERAGLHRAHCLRGRASLRKVGWQASTY